MSILEDPEDIFARENKKISEWVGIMNTFKENMKYQFTSLEDQVDQLYNFLKKENPDVLEKSFDFGYKDNEIIVNSDELSLEDKNLIFTYIKSNSSLNRSLEFFGRDIHELAPFETNKKDFFARDFLGFIDKEVQSKINMLFSDLLDPIVKEESIRGAHSMKYEHTLGYF